MGNYSHIADGSKIDQTAYDKLTILGKKFYVPSSEYQPYPFGTGKERIEKRMKIESAKRDALNKNSDLVDAILKIGYRASLKKEPKREKPDYTMQLTILNLLLAIIALKLVFF